jgi:rSAM/selenodomain-associated transferase 2
MASISVIIPTLNAADDIGPALVSISSLDGLAMIREVIFSDGGSSDDIHNIAQECGAALIVTEPGRGGQLQAGAAVAKGEWLLFLHADTALEAGWERALNTFMRDHSDKVGYFRFALNDSGLMPRLLECLVAFRCRLLALPYGDQALFISRAVYDQVGGYGLIPLMEDVEFVRRLGRGRLRLIDKKAVTSASRYKADGYCRRMVRNFCCLTLYWFGMPPARIKRLYGS